MGQRASPHQTSTTMTRDQRDDHEQREQPPAEARLRDASDVSCSAIAASDARRRETTIVSTAVGAGCGRRRWRDRRPRDGACLPRPARHASRARVSRSSRLARGGSLRRRSSTTSNRIAVMLSSPPPRFAAWISAFAPGVEVVAVAAARSRSIVVARRPSSRARREQSRKTSPGCGATANASTSTSGSVPSARVITERCGCTSASPRRQLAAPHELGDERVVVGQLLELVVAQEVGARVADVAERDDAVRRLDERDRHRRPHARGAGVVDRALVHAPVRLLDQLRRRAARRRRSRSRSLQRGGGERRGELAGLRAAHAVGDREERRRARRTRPRCGAACGRCRSRPA